ncbi:MAG: NUDIX domain-containing protein [Gemmataceae bacterium]
MTRTKHAHCSYCGHAFPAGLAWPRACAGCASVSYLNPTPVAVAVVPVPGGVLTVRRAIPPVGKLALPGGFMEAGETWQEACVRELREETGVASDPAAVTLFDVHSARDVLLVFGLLTPLDALPPFTANHEVSELVAVAGPAELAFPLHTRVLARYFASVR